jgi:predicted DNA-binding protein YlxM (UPF0122 family)
MEPWHDETTLRYMYHTKKMDQSEIADELGCCEMTVSRWMDRHDIETDKKVLRGVITSDELRDLYHNKEMSMPSIAEKLDVSEKFVWDRMEQYDIDKRCKSEAKKIQNGNSEYRNKEWLREKYWEDRLSLPEIAGICDVSASTVADWMREFNIETRSISEGAINHHLKNNHIPTSHTDGYLYWVHTHRNETDFVAVHRLLAVSEFGFDAVVDKDVHHKNGIRWDNRVENIEILSKSEHGGLHANEYHNND